MLAVRVLVGAVMALEVVTGVVGCPGPRAVALHLSDAGAYGRYELRLETDWVAGSGCNLYTLFVYKLDLSDLRCSADLATNAPKRLHSFNESDLYLVQDSPQINLTHYFDYLFGGCYEIKYEFCREVNDTDKYCGEPWRFQKWLQNNHTEAELRDLLSPPTLLSSKISLSTPFRWQFDYVITKGYIVNLSKSDVEPSTNDITKFCGWDDERLELSCMLPNDTKLGKHNMDYESKDPRCKAEIFQNFACFVQSEFDVLEDINEIPEVSSSRRDVLMTPLIGLSSLLVLVILLLVYYRYTKRGILLNRIKMLSKWKSNYINVASNLSEVKLKGIVLVYARDCEPFMEAMVHFRHLLERHCKVKVYDIFDSQLYNNEIVQAPMEWAQKILAEPGVRVVVVRTPCGELLYEAMMVESVHGLQLRGAAVPTRAQYRGAARYTDTLLLFLFRLIKDDAVRVGSYSKYFMVHIANFSGAKQLPQVNPYERYELPAAVGLLACSIQDGGDAPPDEGFDVDEDNLRLAVHNLLLHIQNKPDYIYTDLLHLLQ